jgi:hypothetical protein
MFAVAFTPFSFYLPKGESEVDWFEKSTKNTILNKIWNMHKKIGRSRCLFQKNINTLLKLVTNYEEAFVIVKDYMMNAVIDMACQAFKVNIWSPKTIIGEEIEAYYFNPRNKDLQKKAEMYTRLK